MNRMMKYPAILNDEYPLGAGCPKRETKENTIKAFMRFCPEGVEIDVQYFEPVEEACQWHVVYNFKNKIGLDDMYKECLKIKEPLDVMKEQISLTDHGMVKILYSVVSCSC